MELTDYLRVIRRRWLLILGCALAGLALAALFTFRATPQYTSTARLFVSNSQNIDAYQGSLLSLDRAASYADLATGRKLGQRVVDRLGSSMSATEMAGRINASVVPDTVILQVSVSDPSPGQARKLTQAAADELADFVTELETPPGKRVGPIKATVIDDASLPASPTSPQPIRNAGLGLLLGTLIGLGMAVLREQLDTSIKTREDVAAAAGAPIMGTVAYDSSAAKNPLVTSLGSHAPRLEAFRVLRTNMQFVDVDRNSKVFVVTSSLPEEGKTTTSMNLAITMAQAGQRVILVEADLRRPKMAAHLRMEESVGLTTVLIGQVDVQDAIQQYSEAGLAVLTSGKLPPNPSELLQSAAMASVLNELRTSFDVVVIDAPPLLPVTDAALLTAQSDGALIVIRHGKTTRDQLHASFARLEAVGGRVVGVVLNMIPRRHSGHSYYGGGYGYGNDGGRGHVSPPGPRASVMSAQSS